MEKEGVNETKAESVCQRHVHAAVVMNDELRTRVRGPNEYRTGRVRPGARVRQCLKRGKVGLGSVSKDRNERSEERRSGNRRCLQKWLKSTIFKALRRWFSTQEKCNDGEVGIGGVDSAARRVRGETKAK